MLKIKTDSNNQIDIENKSIEVSDKVSTDGAVTITAKAPTEIKIIKATAAKAIITDKGEIPITTEDAKSVRKVVGIIRAPFAESIKQNGGAASDEFTYVKTPGKITKIFLHLVENRAIKNVYTSGSNDEESIAIRNQMQTREIDGNTYFVDADGVVRYDIGNPEYNSFIKIVGDDIITVFDIEFVGNSHIAKIADALTDTRGNAAAYQKLVENLTKDGVTYFSTNDGSHFYPINNIESARNLIENEIANDSVVILSSDKIAATGWSQDMLSIDRFNSADIQTMINRYSSTTYSNSVGYVHGLFIIEQALATGRALDLGIIISRN